MFISGTKVIRNQAKPVEHTSVNLLIVSAAE